MSNKKEPFFARFLESQELEDVSGGHRGCPPAQTKKFPSDNEEGVDAVTAKFPSDNEESIGGPQTRKFPSDQEDGVSGRTNKRQ
jgi:hypothetical protein